MVNIARRPNRPEGGERRTEERLMTKHPSTLKRMRQDEKKRLRNSSFRSKVKTVVKKYLTAVDEMQADASQLLRQASSLLQKGVSKGVFHRNTAARKMSRLAKKLSAVQTEKQ
jgi:small subunit ribosomal protein S20